VPKAVARVADHPHLLEAADAPLHGSAALAEHQVVLLFVGPVVRARPARGRRSGGFRHDVFVDIYPNELRFRGCHGANL
jgi:hypothetical protein